MFRFVYILYLCLSIVVLAGCNPEPPKDVLIEGIKLDDLAPVTSRKTNLPAKISLDIYMIEVPIVDVNFPARIWTMLQTEQFIFKDYDVFVKNSLSVGFERFANWDRITGVLRSVGGRMVEQVSLILFDNKPSDIKVAWIAGKDNIYYIPPNGPVKTIKVRSGALGLRIKTDRIPGARGVCVLNIKPVFVSAFKSYVPKLHARNRRGEHLFESLAFELKMSPGDFILLGPDKYLTEHVTLAGRLFNVKKPIPVNRFFLLLCLRIDD